MSRIYLIECWDNDKIENLIINNFEIQRNEQDEDVLPVSEDEAASINEAIKSSLHTLLKLPINQKTPSDGTLEAIGDEIAEIINHDTIKLVSSFRNYREIANMKNGINHNQNTPNPYTNQKRIKSDQISFSFFKNIREQGELFKESAIYRSIYLEMKKMVQTLYCAD